MPLLQVTSSQLSRQCTACGSNLAATIKPGAARKRLVLLRNLGAFHKFSLLQQLADTALANGQVT